MVLFTEAGEFNCKEFSARIAMKQGINWPGYLQLTKLIHQRFGYSDVDRFTKGCDLKRHVHFQTVIEKAIPEQRMYLTSEGSVMLTKS